MLGLLSLALCSPSSTGVPQQSAGCMEELVESLHPLDAKGSPAGAALVACPAWGQCCVVLWVGAWRGAGPGGWA